MRVGGLHAQHRFHHVLPLKLRGPLFPRQRTPFADVAGSFKCLRSLDDAYYGSNGEVEQDFCFGRAEQLARVALTFRIRGEAAMSVRSFF